jgi:predicted dehydrogenase/threonine dehydrogenase-like Zn-dependent dehydrogenase
VLAAAAAGEAVTTSGVSIVALMKQVAQNYKSGEISLLDVPVPLCKPGGVLVRSEFSLISMGTESMKIHESKLSMIGKARARPDQVRKVVETLAQLGPVATYQKVMSRLDSFTPLGYSLSGIVVAVGDGAGELTVGQRVACGGNQYALHAEYNWVPRNLCVAVPDGVAPLHAAFTTVAAIAMQGFRQSEAKLGESACVIGLGLVGQILVQILCAAGLKVVGIDLAKERCDLALASGAVACGRPGDPSLDAVRTALAALSAGAGADHVFLTSGGSSNEPVLLAAELARDRARVTDIGKCKLDLPWTAYYEKELDVRFSRSYGPGRYDPSYEERGIDYPIGYVRWTERRNMACVLDLLAARQLDFDALIGAVEPFESAVSVYERINRGAMQGLGVVFAYRPDAGTGEATAPPPSVPYRPRAVAAPLERLRLGVIGCGNYASTMLLPHLKRRGDVELAAVATTTALSAANAQAKFGFARVTTDHRSILADPEIDAVLIATRHDSHARLVCETLRGGKAALVEKPLAVTAEQLAAVRDAVAETGNDRLMVGFNRRFARILAGLRAAWGDRGGPETVLYTVNAGPLDPRSWYRQSDEQGSRFAGEGGHFIDAVSWWLGADPLAAQAVATADDPDNLVALLTYPDGSVAKIAYLTAGDARYPKEVLEVFGGGRVARLDNFKRSELWHRGKCRSARSLVVDKGQKQEIDAFVRAVRSGGEMPIAFASLLATTACTLAVGRSIASGRCEAVAADSRAAEGEAACPALWAAQ